MANSVFVKRYRRKKDIRRLEKIIRRHPDKVTVKKTLMVLMSIRGAKVSEIKNRTGCSPKYVRQIIHEFNQKGFSSLWHVYGGGRKPIFSEAQREEIAQLALLPPRALKIPVNRWTLSLLAEEAVKRKMVKSISYETVRQILMEFDVRLRRTKTWKETKDPQAEAKWRRIKRLYRNCPAEAHVISFDPFGPMEIRPIHGLNYCQGAHVKRLPATYRRTQGVRHFLAFLDVHTGEMWGIIVKKKNWRTILQAFKKLRDRYPESDRLYVILDNAGSHKKREVTQWTKRSNVRLVYTATNASWMNRIESHFNDFWDKVMRGEYPKDHAQLRRRIHQYLRWRNDRKETTYTGKISKRKRVA